MSKELTPFRKLFEVKDVLGRKIRTTKTYWRKIRQAKHRELRYGAAAVKQTLRAPIEIRQSVTDATIELYSQKMTGGDILVVVVKILNSEGFVITVYQTKRYKAKGRVIWTQKNL